MTTEKVSRTCVTCACLHILPHPLNPLEKMSVCRLHPPMLAQAEGTEPRLDANKNIVVGKDGKPVMQKIVKQFYSYPPMGTDMTCFDGWRPLGKEPGEKYNPAADAIEQIMKDHMEAIVATMSKIPLDG